MSYMNQGYKSSVFKHDLLGRSEENNLIEQYQDNGDIVAKHKVILHNQNIVWKCARKYYNYAANTKSIMTIITFDDLCGYGNVGLHEALERFKITKGVRFFVFAESFVKGHIQQAIQKFAYSIRIPSGQHVHIERYNKTLHDMCVHGKKPSYNAVFDKMNISKENKAILAYIFSIQVSSISKPSINGERDAYDDQKGKEVEIEDQKSADFIRTMDCQQFLNMLYQQCQNDVERECVSRYFFGNESFKKMSRDYNIFPETIARRMRDAIVKTKYEMHLNARRKFILTQSKKHTKYNVACRCDYKSIVKQVLILFDISESDFLKKDRSRKDLAHGRQIVMYILHIYLDWSYPRIGLQMQRAHPVVMQGVKKVMNNFSMKADAELIISVL